MKKIISQLIFVGGLILSSSVNAQTWTAHTSGTTKNIRAVQFLDANNGFVCGDSGTVLKTTNGGIVWTPVNIPSDTIPVNDVFFININEGWLAVGDENNYSSSGEIWHTTNGGTTWTKQTPTTTEARFGVSFASSSVGWEVGSRNGTINIDATINGGTTWTAQSDPNIFGWVYKIDALSTTTAFAICGAFFPSVTGFIIKTTNGGSTWSQNTTGNIPFLNGIDMTDAANGFVVGDGGFIMATANGGTTWTTQTSGTTDTLQDVSANSALAGWACGFNGTILSTTNGGATWTSENSGVTQNLNGIFALDTALAWGTTVVWAVGDKGTILSTGLVGIPENKGFDYNLNVSPNPFSNSTTISFNAHSINEPFSFIVYDVTGKEIKRMENIISSKIILSKENLSAGMYNYSLLNKEKSIVSRGKLIIN